MNNESLFKKFITYLFAPKYYIQETSLGLKRKLFDFVRLIAMMYLVSIIFGILITAIISATGYDANQNAVVDLVRNSPIFTTVILGVIVAPITEELTFRLGLRFSYKKLAIALTFIAITLFDLLRSYVFTEIPDWILSIKNFLGLGGLSYFVFIVLFGLTVFFLSKKFINKEKAEKFYQNNFGKLFYISIISFGLIHITNYFELNELILLTPIFILPQINAGIFLGYIRMNFGFKWNVLTHAIYNFITIFPFIILSFGTTNLQTLVQGGINIDSLSNLSSVDLFLILGLFLFVLIGIVTIIGLNLQVIIEYFLKIKKK